MRLAYALSLVTGLLAFCAAPASSQDVQAAVPVETSPPVQKASAEDSEMVCRRQDVTGSFVQKRKVCRTRAEWRRLAEDHRAQAQEYVEHGRGGSNGN